MKKILLIFSVLFILFTEGVTAQIVGGAGIIKFIGNPNSINSMRVINEKQYGSQAWDTVNNVLWKYDRTKSVGSRWIQADPLWYSTCVNGIMATGNAKSLRNFFMRNCAGDSTFFIDINGVAKGWSSSASGSVDTLGIDRLIMTKGLYLADTIILGVGYKMLMYDFGNLNAYQTPIDIANDKLIIYQPSAGITAGDRERQHRSISISSAIAPAVEIKKYTSGYPTIADTATKAFQQWGTAYAYYDSISNSIIKLNRQLRLRDFGAKGDADTTTRTGTNDNAAFQRAIDYAGKTGGIVLGDSGKVYLINAALNLRSGITIDLVGSTIIVPNSTDINWFLGTNVSNVTFKNTKFYGNRLSFSSPYSATVNKTVQFNGTGSNILFDNCIFEEIIGSGISTLDISNLRVSNCKFRNIGVQTAGSYNYDAIFWHSSGSVVIKDLYVIGNEFTNIGTIGLSYLNTANDADAVQTTPYYANNIHVENNTFNGIGSRCLKYQSSGTGVWFKENSMLNILGGAYITSGSLYSAVANVYSVNILNNTYNYTDTITGRYHVFSVLGSDSINIYSAKIANNTVYNCQMFVDASLALLKNVDITDNPFVKTTSFLLRGSTASHTDSTTLNISRNTFDVSEQDGTVSPINSVDANCFITVKDNTVIHKKSVANPYDRFLRLTATSGVVTGNNLIFHTAIDSRNAIDVGNNVLVDDNWLNGKQKYVTFNSAKGRFMASIPVSGNYSTGDFVTNSNAQDLGGYYLQGWVRVTTGSTHVSGTDWKLVYVSINNNPWRTNSTGTTLFNNVSTVNVGINNGSPQYKLDIDANTSSAGNPIRLQGLQAGAVSDSNVTSLNGVFRRMTTAQMLSTEVQSGTSNQGAITSGTSGTATTVSFATTFASTPVVTVTPNVPCTCYVTAISTSQFTFNCYNPTLAAQTPSSVYWIAKK